MKPTKLLTLVFSVLIAGMHVSAQEMGTFKDPRDGQEYKTVTYALGEGSLYSSEITIMAENLNYEMEGSYVYQDDEGYRDKLGLLYTWEAAMKGCPDGWHLPSDDEWDQIINTLGGAQTAGKVMKSKGGWSYTGNGTNESGFNGLPGGYRDPDGVYHFVGDNGFWWSSTEMARSSQHAYKVGLDFHGDRVNRTDFNKGGAISCRCVLD